MYRVKRSLSHADDQREDHKYIARVETKNPKNKWRYFYTMADYNAYLKSPEAKKDKVVSTQLASNTKTLKTANVKNNTKNSSTSAKSSVGSSIQNKAEKGKNAISNLINSITSKSKDSNAVSKATKEVKSKIDKITNEVTSVKNVEKGKNAVEKILKKVDKASDELVSKGKSTVDKVIKNIDNKISKAISEASTMAVEAGKKLVEAYNVVADYNIVENASKFANKIMEAIVGPTISDEDCEFKPSTTAEQDPPASLSELKKKSGNFSKDQDMAESNPNYNWLVLKWSGNSAYSGAAYELRQRGYDVEAGSLDDMNTMATINDMMSWYDGAQLESLHDSMTRHGNSSSQHADDWTTAEKTEALVKDIVTQGDGARGHLTLYPSYGGMQTITYEVENGQMVIRNCLTNEKSTLSEYMDTYRIEELDYCNYFRTDNLEINENILKGVRNKK